MAAPTSNGGGVISAINVTPFVDVVLVLLVILMVTSTAIANASLGVDLPRAASAGEGVDRTLNVIVRGDGALLVDGEPIDDVALGALTRRTAAAHPDLRAVVSADRDAPYHAVVRAIDVVKGNGVTKFALDVERGASR